MTKEENAALKAVTTFLNNYAKKISMDAWLF